MPQQQHQHLINHRTSGANQQHNADDDYQDDHGMRVGNNYQAEIPQLIAYAPAPEYYEEEKAIRVWSPNNNIPEHVLDEFVNKAKDKFYYSTEQALGMLSWHKFDLNRAYSDLPNFVPYPNEWSVEDKVLFEQAYTFHEKQFHKIKSMLPDKTIAQLINFYYGWKKKRSRASLMERQTKRFAARKNANSNGPSDEEEVEGNQITTGKDDIRRDEITNNGSSQSKDTSSEEQPNEDQDIQCAICQKQLRVQGRNVGVIVDGVADNFCPKCWFGWKGKKLKLLNETEIGDCFYNPTGEPKKILFSYYDVMDLVSGSPEQGDTFLKSLDNQIQDIKRDIQTRKQTLSQINEKIQPIADQIADLNMSEFSDILPTCEFKKTWDNDEVQLVIQGLRRYGTDFGAIADVVRTKAPDIIRLFYVTQKERLGLQLLVNEYERNRNSSTDVVLSKSTSSATVANKTD